MSISRRTILQTLVGSAVITVVALVRHHWIGLYFVAMLNGLLLLQPLMLRSLPRDAGTTDDRKIGEASWLVFAPLILIVAAQVWWIP